MVTNGGGPELALVHSYCLIAHLFLYKSSLPSWLAGLVSVCSILIFSCLLFPDNISTSLYRYTFFFFSLSLDIHFLCLAFPY